MPLGSLFFLINHQTCKPRYHKWTDWTAAPSWLPRPLKSLKSPIKPIEFWQCPTINKHLKISIDLHPSKHYHTKSCLDWVALPKVDKLQFCFWMDLSTNPFLPLSLWDVYFHWSLLKLQTIVYWGTMLFARPVLLFVRPWAQVSCKALF